MCLKSQRLKIINLKLCFRNYISEAVSGWGIKLDSESVAELDSARLGVGSPKILGFGTVTRLNSDCQKRFQ